jgi:DNA-binding NarL/FixJ family response regulator
VITGDHEPELLRAAEEAGADAVVLKDELAETLIERLHSVKHVV